MSRREELDHQPEGLDHGKTLSSRLSGSPILNPEGGGDGAGNTVGDIYLT